ncbi:hypothetical protein LJB68_14790, partial [bacterium 210820-DFI.6.52]|nr:hypothetical protein [bacterium 210820-DFI.6.52]
LTSTNDIAINAAIVIIGPVIISFLYPSFGAKIKIAAHTKLLIPIKEEKELAVEILTCCKKVTKTSKATPLISPIKA